MEGSVKLKLGINEYISNEDYHADREYISSSGLKKILVDPRGFYKEYVLNEGSQLSSSALDFGSYLHCAILEPHLLDEEFAVYDGAMKRGKKFEQFAEENEGKTIITTSQEQQAKRLINNFNEATVVIGKQGHDKEVQISSFYSGGFAEQTFCHEINGIKVKVRTDYRKEFEDFGSINDLKTTGDIADTARDASRICDAWGYDVSAALYVDVVSAVTDKPHDFYFTFLSKKNGEVRIFKASEAMLERGRKKYLEAIELLKKARDNRIYYVNEIKEID